MIGDPVLDMPAEHDLGGCHPVLGRDPGKYRVAQVRAFERAVSLNDHAALAVRGQQPRVMQARAPRDLVHRRCLTGGVGEFVDLADAVVTYAHGAREALLVYRQELAPGLRPRAALRWPVHQPQVDVVDAKRAKARGERLAFAADVARGQFRGNEDVAPFHPAVAQRPPDLRLVAVHGGRVDVPVSDFEGEADRLTGRADTQPPGTEAHDRHGHAAGQRHRWNGVRIHHPAILAHSPGASLGQHHCSVAQR